MVKKFLEIMRDDNRALQERSFILLSTIGLLAMLVMLVSGLIIGENITDLIVIGAGIGFFFVTVFAAVKYKKTKAVAVALGFIIVFVLIPMVFFTGGALKGGAPIWIVFCILFISMGVEGKARIILFVCAAGVITGSYLLAYFKPELVAIHTDGFAYMDSYISLIIVCGMLSMMVGFELRTLKRQKEISDAKTKEVEELNKAQNRFFSNMSHEIRTPINTIIGLNEMILRQNASDEINEDAQTIGSASKMLLSLINDILDMSKFESGQMELNNAAYHPGDMLSEIVGMLWIRAKVKNLKFHVDVAPDIPSELYGDEIRIKQVLINVINNAIKYTSEGTVRLSITCERTDDQNMRIFYAVSDTGMGIKKESLPYLFTAYKRVDEEKNKYIEGTGLGLSIVKQFVDLMGGKITVNSVYTKGSTFVIEIPQRVLNSEPVGELDVENRHKAAADHKHVQSFIAPDAHILVVDDTRANIMVVSKLLGDTQIDIDTALSGEAALEMTLNKEYHVILMDHMMPGMDGIECMHAIRNQTGGLNCDTKIVALTANAGSDSEILYEKEGFDGYLTKPVTGNELENAVYHLLPKDLVTVTGTIESLEEQSTAWIREHLKKATVKITTESVADIPKELLRKYNISQIPHMVRTDEGLFKDGIELDTRGVIEYMEENPNAEAATVSPSVDEHISFFADQLDTANNIVHISISGGVKQSGYYAAREAAENFGNVKVIDSGHLSSGQGLMAIEAARLAREGMMPDEIVKRMEKMKSHINTSFVVDSLRYLVRQKQIQTRIGRLADAFLFHPMVVGKKGKMTIKKIFFGSKAGAWKKYISTVFNTPGIIDKRMLFITYVGMTSKELEYVKKLAEEKVAFEKIYVQKASPAVAVNSGPGTFGMLFFTEY